MRVARFRERSVGREISRERERERVISGYIWIT